VICIGFAKVRGRRWRVHRDDVARSAGLLAVQMLSCSARRGRSDTWSPIWLSSSSLIARSKLMACSMRHVKQMRDKRFSPVASILRGPGLWMLLRSSAAFDVMLMIIPIHRPGFV